MKKDISVGAELMEKAKGEAVDWFKDCMERNIPELLNWLEKKLKDEFPKFVKKLLTSKDAEKKIVSLWSDYVFEEGIIPDEYKGLPDKYLIDNLHQDGYLTGLFTGYALAMMALADSGVSKDIIFSTRDYIRPYLIRHHYNDNDEIVDKYKREEYLWIEKENN